MERGELMRGQPVDSAIGVEPADAPARDTAVPAAPADPAATMDVQASPDVQAVPPDARREQVTVQEQPRPGHSLITELAQGLAAHVPPAEPTAAELTAAAAEVTRDTADDRCSVKLR